MKKSILHVLGSNLLSKLVATLFSIYLARWYGASFLGSYVLLLSIWGFSTFFSKMGLIYALEKRIGERPEKKVESSLISTALVINVCLLGLTLLILLILGGEIEEYIGKDNIIFYLIITTIISNYSNFVGGILRARKKFKIYSNTVMIREVLPKVLSFIILLINEDFSVLVISLLIGELLALIYSLLYLDGIKLNLPTIKAYKSLFSLTKYNAALEMKALAFNWIDVWMIGLFLSQSYVGIYQAAWQIASAILIINKSLTTVYFPYFNQWIANYEYNKLQTFLKDNTFLFSLFPIPMFMASLVMSKDIMNLFGANFGIGNNTLSVLLICTLFRSLNELQSKVLVSLDKSKDSFIASSYSGIATIVLNYILVQLLGIEGAAIATTLGVVINYGVSNFYLKKYFKIIIVDHKVLVNLCGSLIMALVIYFTKNMVGVVGVVGVIINICIGIIVWTIVAFTNKNYRDLIINLKASRQKGIAK